jgi:nitrate/TMAO reductase-like tetraheme cytochrome c subunit
MRGHHHNQLLHDLFSLKCSHSKFRLLLGLLIFGFVLSLCPRQSSAEIYGQYIGSQTCADCHNEVSQLWSQTSHANAYDSLLNSGQQDLPACLQCHVVGYGETGGFLDHELTPELAGVQCESCHGPGKRHIDAPDDTRHIIRSPTEKDCRICHTIDQDPYFDFNNKAALVHAKDTTGDGVQSIEQPSSRVTSTLSIEKTIHELGRVQEGTPAIVYTRIENTGGETIAVTDVISS